MAVLLFGQRKSVLRPFLCRDERTPRFRSADGAPAPLPRFHPSSASLRRSLSAVWGLPSSLGGGLPRFRSTGLSPLPVRLSRYPRWLSASSRVESLALPLQS